MPVTTLSAALHISPVVIQTFLRHGKRKAKKFKDGAQEEEALDDIFFDEAFHIVRSFIEMGTKNTIESLQAFTNTHVPSPYWAAVAPVCVPLSSCNRAADVLINWFGPDDLTHVVGGERWWQVRGLDGIDAEWITERDYLSDEDLVVDEDRKLSSSEGNILRMEGLQRVMFYVHGGGYFWGSLNTHRYQVIRYARKMKGRVFAVNYRKAPQYPWPCPLQDVLAAYFYLIQPPPNALHSPIPPSKIVFAGDSAGGGLCLTALTVLRDLGHPLPAGAVLISPWVDLTHSFPSVMQNTDTDIIPPYGFLARPSTLWPIDLLPPEGGRIKPAQMNPPPKPGHTDTLTASEARKNRDLSQYVHNEEPAKVQEGTNNAKYKSEEYDIDVREPKPPKVLMKDPNAVPLQLCSQIQLYATTEQLTHPLVSPILQGSLGNLPPLYILAGDKEVLRDEIIYFAHRAAYPESYPARQGILRDGLRQRENAEKYKTPTKVHLQVYDGMCHVLTVFSFTQSAKHAYRSIAAFVKQVTDEGEDSSPFPELLRSPSTKSTSERTHKRHQRGHDPKQSRSQHAKSPTASDSPEDTDNTDHAENIAIMAKGVPLRQQSVEKILGAVFIDNDNTPGSYVKDTMAMIRERVDIHGKRRPMEPEEETQVLKIKPGEVGFIKEAPAMRWHKGQCIWDEMYKHEAAKAVKKRRKLEAKAKRMLDNARDQGLLLSNEVRQDRHPVPARTNSQRIANGDIQAERRWGPLDLDDELPPPSAIARRRDTPEALALLKKSIYHTPPVTHQSVPRMKKMDVVKAAFNPHDDPIRPPRQSVSEEQVKTHFIPVHGLRVWDALVR